MVLVLEKVGLGGNAWKVKYEAIKIAEADGWMKVIPLALFERTQWLPKNGIDLRIIEVNDNVKTS